MPGSKQAWPISRRLLVAGDAADRRSRRRAGLAVGRAEIVGIVLDLGQHRARHAGTAPAARRPTRRSRCCRAACARHWWRRWRATARRSAARSGSCRRCRRPVRRARRAAARPATLSSIQRDLGAGEIGIEQQPGAARRPAARARRASARSQIAAVRRSCQTMALWIGLPVARSQTIVVSRWLVMPMAAMSPAVTPALPAAPSCSDHRQRRPDLLGDVLDPARLRKDAG